MSPLYKNSPYCECLRTLSVNSLTCRIGAYGPVDLVLALKLHHKRSSVTRSVTVHYIKPGGKRISIAQADFPLLDHRKMVIHIQQIDNQSTRPCSRDGI